MASVDAGGFDVQVCYALPDRQTLLTVHVALGATVHDAIKASGVVEQHGEIDLTVQKVGVWGKVQSLDTALAPRDRIEIYRPLTVDPKVARQRRVHKARAAGTVEGRKWKNKDAR